MGTQNSKLPITETRRGNDPNFCKEWLPADKIETWTLSRDKEASGSENYYFCAWSKAFDYPWSHYGRCVSFPSSEERAKFLHNLAFRKP